MLAFWKVCSFTVYVLNTGRGSFALITASIRHGMEVISLWHCWGGMEAQVSLTVAFSSSAFFGLLFLIFLSTILDFMQLGLWASPPFLQTLGPWFPNGIQNLLSSEKRTLDHWATVQFFFSLAQVRRLWRCLWFRSGLTRGIRQLQPNSLTHLCVVALDALTPASVYSLWSSPKFLNRFCWQSS